jgi:hypothetical protein
VVAPKKLNPIAWQQLKRLQRAFFARQNILLSIHVAILNRLFIFTRRGFAVPMYGFEKNTREVCTADATLSSSAISNAIKQSVMLVSMILSVIV